MEFLEDVPVSPTKEEVENVPSNRQYSTSYYQKQGKKQDSGKNNNDNNSDDIDNSIDKHKNNSRRRPPQNKKPAARNNNSSSSRKVKDQTKTPSAVRKPDENLCADVAPDPRGDDPEHRMTKKSAGRNTESFDPGSTLVRPALRVKVGSPLSKCYNRFPLRHDDVVIVPEMFGPEEDWKLYYQLVEEMTDLQQQNVKGTEWISWHEGAHLVAKNPSGSKTFQLIIDYLCDYFRIEKKSIGTRFNWYKDSSDWKPFHHDSA